LAGYVCVADWQFAFEEVETEMPGMKEREGIDEHENHEEGVVWRRRRGLQIKSQAQVEVKLARGGGRYQQLWEVREIQYFEDIFLTFCCYQYPGQVDGLTLPKEG
jgi:hypothetical protein